LLTEALTAWAKIAPAPAACSQHVGVDAQGHSWVGVAEPGGGDVDGIPGQKQCGRVQVT